LRKVINAKAKTVSITTVLRRRELLVSLRRQVSRANVRVQRGGGSAAEVAAILDLVDLDRGEEMKALLDRVGAMLRRMRQS